MNCLFLLTETKLQAPYAAPIDNDDTPKYDLYVSVDIKYAKTTMNVRTISTPKRSQAARFDVCAMAACKLPWYPGTVTLQINKLNNNVRITIITSKGLSLIRWKGGMELTFLFMGLTWDTGLTRRNKQLHFSAMSFHSKIYFVWFVISNKR